MTDRPKSAPRRPNAEDKSEDHRRRDQAYFAEMHRERAINEAKTARLRDLRLAKEAADRAAGLTPGTTSGGSRGPTKPRAPRGQTSRRQ